MQNYKQIIITVLKLWKNYIYNSTTKKNTRHVTFDENFCKKCLKFVIQVSLAIRRGYVPSKIHIREYQNQSFSIKNSLKRLILCIFPCYSWFFYQGIVKTANNANVIILSEYCSQYVTRLDKVLRLTDRSVISCLGIRRRICCCCCCWICCCCCYCFCCWCFAVAVAVAVAVAPPRIQNDFLM